MADKSNPSAHWVKSQLIESYSNTVRKAGVVPDMRRIEELATEDCEVHDQHVRNRRPAPATKAPPPRRNAAARMAEAEGKKLITGKRVERKSDPLLDTVKPGDMKMLAMMARIKQILVPRSDFRPSQENDYAAPALAEAFILNYQRYMRGRGEYRGKSGTDARRIFRRRLEDICDKSNPLFGNWWCK